MKETKSVWYEFNQDGKLIKKTGEVLPGGIYQTVDGKWPVRISDRTRGVTHCAASDDLGTQGILCHADNKMYDSRTKYYQAIKAANCHIAEPDSRPTVRKEVRGDFNIRKELKSAVQQHLTGGNHGSKRAR